MKKYGPAVRALTSFFDDVLDKHHGHQFTDDYLDAYPEGEAAMGEHADDALHQALDMEELRDGFRAGPLPRRLRSCGQENRGS